MAMDETTIPFITLPNWQKAARACGFSIEPILQRHGVTVDLQDLGNATITVTAMDQVMRECILAAGEQHYPFVLGDTFAFEYMPDLETFVTTSGSIRDATRIFAWLRELVNPLVEVSLEEQGRWARIVLSDADGRHALNNPYHSETMYASIVRFGRILLGSHGDFRCLRFRHPEPTYSAAYQQHFKMPLSFSRPRYELEFDRELLDRPLQGASPQLHRQAEDLVRRRLARHTIRGTITGRVTSALDSNEALLRGNMANTAAALGMGERTLQRRLSDENASFANLQTRARYRKAASLLLQTHMNVEEVSEILGFADRRSFSRAFKRWSGFTPGEYRRRPDSTSNLS